MFESQGNLKSVVDVYIFALSNQFEPLATTF